MSDPAQHIETLHSGRQATENEFAQASHVIDHTAGKHCVLFFWCLFGVVAKQHGLSEDKNDQDEDWEELWDHKLEACHLVPQDVSNEHHSWMSDGVRVSVSHQTFQVRAEIALQILQLRTMLTHWSAQELKQICQCCQCGNKSAGLGKSLSWIKCFT